MAQKKEANVINFAQLIQALCNPACYDHEADRIELIETHISFVILSGDFVYKIKKPVNFGFLDFSTLEKRKYYCGEELRLNRRHSPDIYLEVVAIGGPAEQPVLHAKQDVIEYAVKMRRFSQENLLDHRLAQNKLSGEDMDALAQSLVDFHHIVATASPESDYGSLAQITKYTLENCDIIAPCLSDNEDKQRLRYYQNWVSIQHEKLEPLFLARKQQGFIRECHGDLHLRNIMLNDGKYSFFDCIEFNPALRWVDVISELAFLAMDIDAAGRADFSHRVINAYFELTGDYEGLPLLRYYLAYRAMVRSKVAFLRLSQAKSESEKIELCSSGSAYLNLAWQYAANDNAEMIITHGFSGSGKSVQSLLMVERIGAIRVRSDMERKRAHGLSAKTAKTTALDESAYNPDTNQKIYHRLLDISQLIVQSGFPAIVDATFLKSWQRDLFHQYAEQHALKFSILDYHASLNELKRRIVDRQQHRNDVSDASLAVLEQQIKTAEPLTEAEREHVVACETGPANC